MSTSWRRRFSLIAFDRMDASPNAASGAGERSMFKVLDSEVLRLARVSDDPYEHLFAENVIRADRGAALIQDLPAMLRTGSYSPKRLSFGPAFQELLRDLNSPEFRRLVEEKFAVDLGWCEAVTTVRGWCGDADGNVHTDIERKVITLLLYLNPGWQSPDGRLRLLRSPNLNDYAGEIAPEFGNLLIFRRSNRSWHGHTIYHGPRLSVQHNWVKPRMLAVRTLLGKIAKSS